MVLAGAVIDLAFLCTPMQPAVAALEALLVDVAAPAVPVVMDVVRVTADR